MMGPRKEFAPFSPSPQRPRLRLLMVGGVAVAILGGFVLGRAWDSSESAPAQESTEAAGAPAPSVTPDDDGNLSPDDVTWREHAGLVMPFSAEHGPFEDEDGWVRGFARTPQGAVMAGTHIFLQTSSKADLPEEAIRASFNGQLTGEHAEAFVERMVADGFEPDPSRANINVEGYLLHDFDDNGAVLELAAGTATEGADGYPVYTATMLTVMWENGDWQLLVPESTMEHVRLLDTLDEFTPFPRDE